jgi:hypothetical protein
MDQTVGRSNCHLSGHRLEIYRKQRSGCTPFYCLKTYRKRTGNPSISTLGLELLNIAFEPSNDEHEVRFFLDGLLNMTLSLQFTLYGQL